MIFNFGDGTTKSIDVGCALRGLRDSNGGRPLSVTLTYADMVSIGDHPDWFAHYRMALDVRPQVKNR